MVVPARLLAALLLMSPIAAAAPREDFAEPYRILQRANLTLDPALAASAYAAEGVLAFDIPGQQTETFRGAKAIHGAYVRTFGQVTPGTPIELDFRFIPPGLSAADHKGVYRLKARTSGGAITAYGQFSVRLVKQGNAWRFAEDRGTVATASDFDKLPEEALQ